MIGDSLSLPALTPSKVTGCETWPYLVSHMEDHLNKTLFFYCKHGLTSKEVAEASRNLIPAYEADLIICQVGIVDCYPRALKKFELSLILRAGFIGKMIHRLVQMYYTTITTRRNITYVSEDHFRSSLQVLKDQNIPIVYVPILPCAPNLHVRNTKLKKNIAGYNRVMSEILGERHAIPVEDLVEDKFYSNDGYHLSMLGHEMIAQRLHLKLINDI